MPDIKTKYAGAETPLTISLASLADDNTNKLTGRASAVVSNATDLFLDVLVSGKIRAGTSPTADRTIEVWAYTAWDDSVPSYVDGIAGTDSGDTLTSVNVKNGSLRLIASIPTDNTSNTDYFIPPTSIAQLFGSMPKRWGVFVINCTGVALNATGSEHVLNYLGITAQTV
jgi:hypothetical protein